MTRNTKFTELMDAVEGSQKLRNVHYWDGYGFHFYSMLRPVKRIAEAKSKRAMEYAERVLKNYTQAASAASRYYGSECRILEHQGWVIHFYIYTDKREKIVGFAKLLSTLVEGRVMESFDDVTLQFHMAAEYGRSLLIAVDSATSEEAAKSCVSLGPCANDPAKKMGESTEKSSRPLWIRMTDEGAWDVEDCQPDEANVSQICENVMPTSVRDFTEAKMVDRAAVAVCRAQPLKEAVADSVDGYLEAYCFRSDMDGFTKAVKKVFESTDAQAIVEFATNFVGYMQAVNEWQVKDPVVNMVPYPWAGDCCTMLARPNYGKEFGMEDFEASQCLFPIMVFNEWNTFIRQKGESFKNLTRAWRTSGGSAQWVCCASGGVIYPFDVETADRKFRVMVGWPVGISHKGVNLKNSVPDSLVLHQEDLNKLAVDRQKKFKKCKECEDYSYSTRSDLAVVKQEVVTRVATAFGSTAINGVNLRPTRPWAEES